MGTIPNTRLLVSVVNTEVCIPLFFAQWHLQGSARAQASVNRTGNYVIRPKLVSVTAAQHKHVVQRKLYAAANLVLGK